MQTISEGTQTATIGTKHQLYTTSLANTFALLLDTNNMALGDVLEMYVDVACKSGATQRQAYFATYAHNQADPAKISVAIIAPAGATFSLKQTAGTGRAFDWSVAGL